MLRLRSLEAAAKVALRAHSRGALQASSRSPGCARVAQHPGKGGAMPRLVMAMQPRPAGGSQGLAVAALRARGPAAGRSMSMAVEEYNKRMNETNDMFAEARLLIEDALDSQGTTYFEDDLADAQEAVKETLKSYNDLLADLDEKKRGETQRSMGMKMEQLKGELSQILDSLTHDEDLPASQKPAE